jgi:N-acetylglucosaminyldiphosphoundecaprenol N-acetyl-beta-D-mannosaminyltransferase
MDRHYPNLHIRGLYSPPFRALTPEEEERTIERINSSGAKLLFVVLGCPKQEQWMASMAGRINAVMIGIGGALPVLIGMQKRAPKWMQRAGLEWLFRLLQEPRRLFKRYFVTNSVFLYLLSRELVTRTFTKKFEAHEMN